MKRQTDSSVIIRQPVTKFRVTKKTKFLGKKNAKKKKAVIKTKFAIAFSCLTWSFTAAILEFGIVCVAAHTNCDTAREAEISEDDLLRELIILQVENSFYFKLRKMATDVNDFFFTIRKKTKIPRFDPFL